jgi:hypothetical protein
VEETNEFTLLTSYSHTTNLEDTEQDVRRLCSMHAAEDGRLRFFEYNKYSLEVSDTPEDI